MSPMKKAPLSQGLSQPELILSLDSSQPRISKKKLPTHYKKRKPFDAWWEETLEEHWPLENPPDWELLSPSRKRIYKLATLGYFLRAMEGKK